MKKMTCKQLGGACDMEFEAETFADIAKLSQEHGKEMYEKGDKDHIDAMKEMSNLMNDPEAMNSWMEDKRKEFEGLPEE